jgi:tetratricopeptide (TPR) repeat protein
MQEASFLQGQGRFAAARELYEAVLKTEPQQFDALHMLGVLAAQTGDHRRAVVLIGKALKLDPLHAGAHCNLGTALQALGRYDAALAAYGRAIALKPDHAVAHCNHGNVLRTLGRHERALASYDAALTARPDFVDAHCYRGNVLLSLGDVEAARRAYANALALQATLAEAHFNLGNLERACGNSEAALQSFDRAVGARPDFAEAWSNRGFVLRELSRLDAALQSYDRALAIKPDFPEVQWNRATLLLLLGRFDEGWAAHECRWRIDAGPNKAALRRFATPPWLGTESVEGRTLLLWSEQGLGDAIHFARYAALVAARGARVILEVPAPLCGLLAHVEGVSAVRAMGSGLPDHDAHCPLHSLPLALGTRLGTIPCAARYVQSEPDKVARWKARLGTRTRPRIGLCWSGNPRHVNDRLRSVPLADIVAHLPSHLDYVCVQRDVSDADRELLGARRIADYSGDLGDFTDTAALCECLDIVVSVDTSVAHLAGALGLNTWILLPRNPDWRWLTERTDSPWYPSVRLFRQARPGGWHEVLERVAAELTHIGTPS